MRQSAGQECWSTRDQELDSNLVLYFYASSIPGLISSFHGDEASIPSDYITMVFCDEAA